MKVVSRINILSVHYIRAEEYEVTLLECKLVRGQFVAGDAVPVPDIQKSGKLLSHRPLIVAIGGAGVITKETGDWTQKVTSDPERFAWSDDGGRMSFVRRDQTTPFMERLKAAAVEPVAVEYIDLNNDIEEVCRALAERFFASQAKFSSLLRPSGQVLAKYFARRLTLPVLIAL